MGGTNERKRRKEKKREEKLKKKQLVQERAAKDGFSVEERKAGKFQIYLLIAISIIGSAIIIYNLT